MIFDWRLIWTFIGTVLCCVVYILGYAMNSNGLMCYIMVSDII